MYSPRLSEKALFLAAAAPWFGWLTTVTPADEKRRATLNVWSFDPSSTTMISFGSQVCARADSIVCAMQSSALYAGMRIETSGFIGDRPTIENTRFASFRPPFPRSIFHWHNG